MARTHYRILIRLSDQREWRTTRSHREAMQETLYRHSHSHKDHEVDKNVFHLHCPVHPTVCPLVVAVSVSGIISSFSSSFSPFKVIGIHFLVDAITIKIKQVWKLSAWTWRVCGLIMESKIDLSPTQTRRQCRPQYRGRSRSQTRFHRCQEGRIGVKPAQESCSVSQS